MASQRYPESPYRFTLDDIKHTVGRIISEGRTPQGFIFTVEDQTGKSYLLSYDEAKLEWTVKEWN